MTDGAMDATSLVVDFGDGSFDVAAGLAKRLYDQHGCFLAKNLFAADATLADQQVCRGVG